MKQVQIQIDIPECKSSQNGINRDLRGLFEFMCMCVHIYMLHIIWMQKDRTKVFERHRHSPESLCVVCKKSVGLVA